MRQGSPLASSPIQVQDAIDHFTHIGGSGVSSWLGGRDQRFEDPPLVVAHITGVASSHHLSTSSLPFFPFGILFPFLLFLHVITWQACLPSRSPGPCIGLVLFHLASQAFAHSLLEEFTILTQAPCFY